MQLAKTKEERSGLVTTILVHVLLLLCFIFFGLKYEYPTPDDGIKINFGSSDEGSGEVQPDKSGKEEAVENEEETEEVTETTPVETTSAQEKVLTEESSPIAVPKQTEAEIQKKKEEEQKKKQEQEFREKMADIWKKTKKGGSEGETGNDGDQGDPNGDKNSKSRVGGKYDGSGISANLSGRSMLSVPKIIDNSQEEGTVVVSIIVDKGGNVIDATPGKVGSTTTNKTLLQKAKDAAMSTKFSSSSDIYTPEEQRGTMTFVFVLE